jgi:sugar lactone lactonase YvrE
VDGKEMKFPDDFDFIANDTIIFSDASTRYGFNDFLLAFLEHCGDGRIIQFEMSTGKLKVLVDGLNFPNGVQTHPDKKVLHIHWNREERLKKGQMEFYRDLK